CLLPAGLRMDGNGVALAVKMLKTKILQGSGVAIDIQRNSVCEFSGLARKAHDGILWTIMPFQGVLPPTGC
ncbi:hypothetical protein ACQRCJ_12560, partial [Desulfovibrio sp. SGI.102]|uniref:hypothetical protein n=1 Tax=Desulfovibrio sp. SGI.102 TaxID=3420559 RepID=UPI003CFE20C1